MNEKAERAAIPVDIEVEVLTRSRRRCCLCVGLDRNTGRQKGQIAHINRNRSDNRRENLAFLCLDHHDEYDSRTSQAKGISQAEMRHYRDALHLYVEQNLALVAMTSLTDAGVGHVYSRALSATGTPLEASRRFREVRTSAIAALKGYGELIGGISRKIHEWQLGVSTVIHEHTEAAIRRHWNMIGASFESTANTLNLKTAELSEKSSDMFVALETNHVLASDSEFMTVEILQQLRSEVAAYGNATRKLLRTVDDTVGAILTWGRHTTAFNRGRRRFRASLGQLHEELSRQLVGIQEQERVLEELAELL